MEAHLHTRDQAFSHLDVCVWLGVINRCLLIVIRKQPWSTWALYSQVLFHLLWTDPVMTFFWYKSEKLSLTALGFFMLMAKLYR